MGYIANCPDCTFEFFAGHSHHEGASSAVCNNCRAFFACLTKNLWGPSVGEPITVHEVISKGKGRKRRTEQIPTKLQFQAVAGQTTVVGGCEFTGVQYPKEGLPCPVCPDGTIFFGFELTDDCPWCGHNPMKFDSIIY